MPLCAGVAPADVIRASTRTPAAQTWLNLFAEPPTVVIPVDTTSAGCDYETTIGFYEVLNLGNANSANEPLKPKATTPSRTDMVTFQQRPRPRRAPKARPDIGDGAVDDEDRLFWSRVAEQWLELADGSKKETKRRRFFGFISGH